MGLLNLLSQFSGALSAAIHAVKLFVAGLFIRRSTKIEMKKDALEQESAIKDKQIEIASRPPVKPGSVRDSLFRDGF